MKQMHNELINSLDSEVRNRRKLVVAISIDSSVLYSTFTMLIVLLSRKRQNNSLHMHMITLLSEELSHLLHHEFIKGKDKHFRMILFGEADSLLEACFSIMELAESKTSKLTELEHQYIFKDEKNLIREYREAVCK